MHLTLRYNLFNLTFQLVSSIGLILFFIVLFFGVFDSPFENVLFAVIILTALSNIVRAMYLNDFDFKLTDQRLEMTRPFVGGGKSYSVTEIRGYSKSEVHNGAGNGTYLSISNSIVVYLKRAEAIELTTRSYPLRFDEIEKALRELNVPYLGNEPYKVTFFGRREFRFLNIDHEPSK